MAYIGKTPTPAPLTSSDIAADIINSTHIGDTAISGFDALATAPASTDEFLISDGGVLKRLDASFIGGNNNPMFNAHISSDQTINDASATKLQFNVEDFDSDSAYDNSSNYRFTVPSGQAGKYLFQASTIDFDNQSQLQSRQLILYKNGSEYAYQNFYPEHDHGGTANSYMEYGVSLTLNVIVNCSVSDYFEVYYWGNTRDSGSFLVKGDASKRESWFQGHKLIT